MTSIRARRFMRKPETRKFEFEEDGKTVVEELLITPLKVKDQDLLLDMGNPDKDVAKTATISILRKVFHENGMDMTDEEIAEISWDIADGIMQSVVRVNKVDADDAKEKFLQEMRIKQEQGKKHADAMKLVKDELTKTKVELAKLKQEPIESTHSEAPVL